MNFLSSFIQLGLVHELGIILLGDAHHIIHAYVGHIPLTENRPKPTEPNGRFSISSIFTLVGFDYCKIVKPKVSVRVLYVVKPTENRPLTALVSPSFSYSISCFSFLCLSFFSNYLFSMVFRFRSLQSHDICRT